MEYKVEEIGGGVRVCVSKEHTFGTDSFLLADFAHPKREDIACDLGTGCGIVPLLWLRGDSPAMAYGIDVQKNAIEQATASALRSGVTERFVQIHADLKEIRHYLPAGGMDLVSCNPPYSIRGSGVESPQSSRLIARHETLCTMDDVAKAAAWLLRTGARFCVCQVPERLTDVLVSMRQHALEPKRLRLVHQKAEDAPWLVLVEGRRGGKPSLLIEPPLIMRSPDGSPSEELARIYNLYGKVQ